MKRRFTYLLLLMMCPLMGWAQINTDRVMAIGRNALYFEDYVLSIQYFNQVINAKPYLADPYFFRGLAKINLDDFPVCPRSLVSGIDKAVRDRFDPKKFGEPELMDDRTMRRFSYLFELAVGEGRLLVCGFNLTGVECGDPASLSMLKTIVDYASSEEFAPVNGLSVSQLRDYLSTTAASGPQKERMMTQYWQLDDEPVESMDYWTESERYLRE